MPDHKPSLKHLILATAGHVDHGKTALIKALTGIDTDRLPEEKARGITIDLGFAHLALPGLSLGVIDVPGHEDFIRNMIAGLGAIDLALLVVAADDGWMPQTEEHLQILNYLEVRHGVVAITKCDLGDPARIARDLRERLRGTSLREAPIVGTSARESKGVDELKQALALVGASIPPAREIGKPRLFVDRVFTVRGTGTVVTGTLTGGSLARGETVTLQPQKLRARIRGLQSHNQPVEIALPGTRTALNLPDTDPQQIPRGSIVTTVTASEAGRTVDALLERSARITPARPLKNGAGVQVHYGSARFAARVLLFDRRELFPGESGIARLHLAKRAFAFIGDRFIIRDASGRQTIAGGVVLNPEAEQTRFRSPLERAFLEMRATAPDDLRNLVVTQLRRDRVRPCNGLLARSHFSGPEIAAAIDLLRGEQMAVIIGQFVADAAWWHALRKRAIAAVDAEHAAHPERAGLDVVRLRALLGLHDVELEDAFIADLCAQDFSSAQGAIRRRTHRPVLPPSLNGASAKIRAALAAHPFDPPPRRELVADATAQQALRFLSETGEVIILGDEVLLSADAFAKMKLLVAQTIRERGPSTVSELRQILGTTRRVLVPLLERFDREGLTIRQGDRRSLKIR